MVGYRLEDAEQRVYARGLDPDVVSLDGAAAAPDTVVCRQDPPAGARSWRVTLSVAERCPI